MRDALMLEARVAFSRKAQPIWFRVLKWAIAIGVGWYLWRDPHSGGGSSRRSDSRWPSTWCGGQDQTVDTGLGRVERS